MSTKKNKKKKVSTSKKKSNKNWLQSKLAGKKMMFKYIGGFLALIALFYLVYSSSFLKNILLTLLWAYRQKLPVAY